MTDANSIERDAIRVLQFLAAYVADGADPSERGHYTWEGPELAQAVRMAPARLNDCVEILEENGYVSVLRFLGTKEFAFGNVTLTSRGRVEAERLTGQSESVPSHHGSGISMPATPSGSPFGFTDEDWERVALERADGNRLIVVFGHQWESSYFDTQMLRANVHKMFVEALESVPERIRGSIALDYRPLEGGYGGHLFNEIARAIISADIAVFETSDCNANVMIELGVALTWGIRVLPIRRSDSPLPPSDISGQTWAVYENDGAKWTDDHHRRKVLQMCELAIARKKRRASES